MITEHFSILRQDVRHAWRSLRRTPVITITATLTLALGVGATTAVFSVVHAVLIRPLPYPEADTLVELFESNASVSMRVSALNYLSWAERSKSFDAIAAFGSAGLTLTGDGDPDLLNGSVVTASLFDVLRISPIVGRTLRPEDEHRGSSRVVVLSEALWRSRFGADRSIVGRAITLDDERYQVVGVMPATFREVGRAQAAGTAAAQIFVPAVVDPAKENRGNHTLRVVGRLRDGVSIDQARSEMRAVAAALERDFPATNTNWGVRVDRLSDTTVEPQVQRSLLLVLGAVAMVFLIACANVANLMLARGTRRRGELAVRTALGAARSRLVRQLLTESICLALASGTTGILVALMTQPLVRVLVPPTFPRVDEMSVDINVLAFGVLVSIVSGIVFGIVPALRASRVDVSQSLMLAGRASTGSSRAGLRQMLIAAQVAVATMLLVDAALFLQGFVRLQQVPLGFEPTGVLTTRLSLPRTKYSDAERAGAFYDRLVKSTQASGQLQSVGLATSAPFAPGVRASFQLPVGRGQLPPATAGMEMAAEHIVNGDYFRVLEVPVLAGRLFNERDVIGGPAVAIVSQRLARLVWPDRSPLGQTVERGGHSYEVVGVVGDIRGSDTQGSRGGGPDREPRASVYFAAGQLPQRTMTLLVRPLGEPTGASATVREAVRQLDSTLPVQPMRPLQQWLADSVEATRLTTRLAIIFAVSAVLLASIGIYGVLAYTVASRTREIGVRMAIGASRRRVIGLVLREGMTWAAGGMLVGLMAAFAAASLIASLLFGVPPHDLMTFAAVGGAVMLVAFAASAFPAVRAAHIDPTIAMRTE